MEPIKWQLTAEIEVDPIPGGLTVEPQEIARLVREALETIDTSLIKATSIRLSMVKSDASKVS